LSHPLLVEAIEDLFIPVLVFNNKKGKDAELLEKFEEPSWNNPVIRYLNHDGTDVIKRQDRVWSTEATAARMAAALKSQNTKVPAYLASIAAAEKTETAIFAMHCYWEGEAHLGSITGVRNTRSSWLQKKEVVEVEYDPQIVDYKTLTSKALELKCASTIFATTEEQQKTAESIANTSVVRIKKEEIPKVAKLSDQKYYLRNAANLRHLPLTLTQSTQLNATLGKAFLNKRKVENAPQILSPRQRRLLTQIASITKNDPNAFQEFIFPENDEKLAKYQAKLAKKIDELSGRQ
jgi:peptide methionine sulfoxide reductase MsrA